MFKILDCFLKKNDSLVRIRLGKEISFEFSRIKSTVCFPIFSHLRNALIPFCMRLLSLERKFKIEFSDFVLKVEGIQELFEYLDFIKKLGFPINFKFNLVTPNIEKEDLKCLWERINSLETLWENMVSSGQDQLLIRNQELIITYNDFLVFEFHGKKDLLTYVNIRYSEIKKHFFFPVMDFLMSLGSSYPVAFKLSTFRLTLENFSEIDRLFDFTENYPFADDRNDYIIEINFKVKDIIQQNYEKIWKKMIPKK